MTTTDDVALRHLCYACPRIKVIPPVQTHDIPNVKSLSTQHFWWIFNWRIQLSNFSELLPTTISVQYSDVSRFSPNSNKIFEYHCLLSPNRLPAFFAWYPFWDFTWLKLNVSSLFSQKILVNLELWFYPEFKCDGARIADATNSPVSWASCEPLPWARNPRFCVV